LLRQDSDEFFHYIRNPFPDRHGEAVTVGAGCSLRTLRNFFAVFAVKSFKELLSSKNVELGAKPRQI
jgi:hypothetical protein